MLLIVAVALLSPTSAAGQLATWWYPPHDRYPVNEYVPTTPDKSNATEVYAATPEGAERMKAVVELFPPYMLDSRTYYLPGTSEVGHGYVVAADGSDVSFFITEDRAKELAGSRVVTYLLLCELVRIWSDTTGRSDVTVSLAYVPSFKQPVVFAIGTLTEIGVRVVMAS